MIPKIIHIVWIGSFNKKINNHIKYIHTKLPDYEIKIWNENNFKIEDFEYTKIAMNKKAYAFVSDYIRLWALYNYGGTYLDTDVNIIQDPKIDFRDEDQVVVGFEKKDDIGSAVISSIPKSNLIKEMLEHMNYLVNYEPDTIGQIANVKWMKDFYQKNNIHLNGYEQTGLSGLHVLPTSYYGFPNKNSRVIHIMTASWSKKRPFSQKLGSILRGNIRSIKSAIFYEKFRSFFWKKNN